jgi:hypothetical protein
MSNELTTIPAASGNMPLTKQLVIAQKRLIQEVMQSVMIGPTEKNPAGVHYGIIPGCKLPSLYKAGSEVILSTFRIAVDPSVEDLSGYDCFRYRVTCRGVLPSGEIVGSGVGECSTDEDKYKWRGAVSPAEFEATPEDRRRIKFSKPTNWNKDGLTQQVRTNPADLANTVLKMAKKRAQIDLTLTATGASDCFSQDLEDLPEEVRDELVKDETSKVGKPAVTQPQSKKLTENQTTYFPRIKAALDTLHGTDMEAKKATLKTESFIPAKGTYKETEGVEDYRSLDGKRLEILCTKLEKLAEKVKPEEKVIEAEVLPDVCAECMQPRIDGACRNMTCCEGKEYE